MARDPRDRICGGIYHVMNRGNRKMPIFEDDRDRRTFLKILIQEKERYGVAILGGCLMWNHFHLSLLTPHGNLPEFMAQLEGRFARYSNWRHGNVGHVFQGRYRHVVIEHDIHLLTALCYIFLNPVSARLVEQPEHHKWSTFAATVGLAPMPDYLTIDWLASLFPEVPLAEAQRRFRRLFAESKPAATYVHQNEFAVDCEAVRRVLRSYVGEQLQLGTLPRFYRSALRSKLSELVHGGMTEPLRGRAVYEAHVVHGYKLSDIAREMGLPPSTVSWIFRKIRRTKTSAAA